MSLGRRHENKICREGGLSGAEGVMMPKRGKRDKINRKQFQQGKHQTTEQI
jgi:hypothetical protein